MSHHTGNLESFSNGVGESETKQAVPNFYLVHDLELLRSGQGNTALLQGRHHSETAPEYGGRYADAGLNWSGPLRCRPEDVTGVAVSYTRFGEDFLDSTASDGLDINQRWWK